MYGFKRYYISKGGYGFLNGFFLDIIEYQHGYFPDKPHLLSCRLSVKAELKQGSDKPLSYAVLGVCVDVPVFKGGKADSFAVMP